jgi:argininosuccinate lyase
MNVEAAVIEMVGPELGGMLQAGRSRNEEIVTDERRWLASAIAAVIGAIRDLQSVLLARATDETDTMLPAHTHTQPAQPVLLAHHLLAYVEMLDRDAGRLANAAARADRSPAGSGAVAGSGLPLDRHRIAAELGFDGVTDNSIDAVSDRDYVLESVAALAILLGHLSRLAGELVLWSTPYVGFARLDDAFSSGSSMLPNKRNPDSAELVRARAARVEGDLVTVMSLVRGLPLAYHRDLQETRRAMFDAVDSARLGLEVMSGVMAGVAFDRDRMRAAAARGHARAVILADRLVTRGVSFREAHRRVGQLVGTAEASGLDLADLPADALDEALPELDGATAPSLADAIAAADVHGGTAPHRVRAALAAASDRLGRGVAP